MPPEGTRIAGVKPVLRCPAPRHLGARPSSPSPSSGPLTGVARCQRYREGPSAFTAPIRKPAEFGSRCRHAAPLRHAMRAAGASPVSRSRAITRSTVGHARDPRVARLAALAPRCPCGYGWGRAADLRAAWTRAATSRLDKFSAGRPTGRCFARLAGDQQPRRASPIRPEGQSGARPRRLARRQAKQAPRPPIRAHCISVAMKPRWLSRNQGRACGRSGSHLPGCRISRGPGGGVMGSPPDRRETSGARPPPSCFGGRASSAMGRRTIRSEGDGLRARPERLERSADLGREQLRLLPGGEVSALVDLVEVGEGGVGLLDPGVRGSDALAGELGESDRDSDRRRSLPGRTSGGLSVFPVPPGRRGAGAVSQYSVTLSRMWSRVRLPEALPSTKAREIL